MYVRSLSTLAECCEPGEIAGSFCGYDRFKSCELHRTRNKTFSMSMCGAEPRILLYSDDCMYDGRIEKSIGDVSCWTSQAILGKLWCNSITNIGPLCFDSLWLSVIHVHLNLKIHALKRNSCWYVGYLNTIAPSGPSICICNFAVLISVVETSVVAVFVFEHWSGWLVLC